MVLYYGCLVRNGPRLYPLAGVRSIGELHCLAPSILSPFAPTGKGLASRLIHAAGAEATETLCGQDMIESDVLDVWTLPTCKKCLRAIENE